MPVVLSRERPSDWVTDNWGNVARQDWVEVPGMSYEPGQARKWMISGESPGGGGDRRGYLFDAPQVGRAGLYGSRAAAEAMLRLPVGVPGPQSVAAYNASLGAQGIDPSELPYGRFGQVGTARVQSRHGLPIAEFLRPYLGRAVGGPGGAAGAIGDDVGGGAQELRFMEWLRKRAGLLPRLDLDRPEGVGLGGQ